MVHATQGQAPPCDRDSTGALSNDIYSYFFGYAPAAALVVDFYDSDPAGARPSHGRIPGRAWPGLA